MKLLKFGYILPIAILLPFSLHAQTSVSAVVPVTPSNSSQCSVSYVGTVPNLQVLTAQNYNFSTTFPQSGFCTVPVTWRTPLPNSSYAVSCTVESGNAAGYLYGTQISTGTKTANGFNLSVSYYVNNLENYSQYNPGAGAVYLSGNVYVYANGAGQNGNATPYTLSNLGTQYVDCVATTL